MSQMFTTGEGIQMGEGREAEPTMEGKTWELYRKEEREPTGYKHLKVNPEGHA